MSPYEAFWKSKPKIDWLRTYSSKCWVLIPKATQGKGTYKSADGIMVGYFDDSKAYKIWIPHMQTMLKVRDVIFDEYHHIGRVTIHATDDDDLPDLWNDNIPISMICNMTVLGCTEVSLIMHLCFSDCLLSFSFNVWVRMTLPMCLSFDVCV